MSNNNGAGGLAGGTFKFGGLALVTAAVAPWALPMIAPLAAAGVMCNAAAAPYRAVSNTPSASTQQQPYLHRPVIQR